MYFWDCEISAVSLESNYRWVNTDVNVCGAVQFIDTEAPELQLTECAVKHDTTIFLQKQIVEKFLSSTIKNSHTAHPYFVVLRHGGALLK